MQPRPVAHSQDDIPPERRAEVLDISARVTSWATGRHDVRGLLLVGSCAHATERPESDLGLVVIVEDPDQYGDGVWAGALGLGEPHDVRWHGATRAWRLRASAGLELEITFGSRDWARLDPIDPETRKVISTGACPLYDPEGLLVELLAAGHS